MTHTRSQSSNDSTTNNRISSCADEVDPNSLTVEQASERISQSAPTIKSFEKLHIRAALNRILAHDIISKTNVPPHANSAMDGYAVRSEDLPTPNQTAQLQVVNTVMAGKPINDHIVTGQCVRIMTGGKIPHGTDSVIMQEHVRREENSIHFIGQFQAGQNVRAAGEDISIDDTILKKGHQITAADLGLLASLGIAEVLVFRRVRVAFFSTGDELCALGETLQEGQIYDSNRYTLYGMLKRFGADIIDMGVVKDEPNAIKSAFLLAAEQADVLITSGGVSVGDADYVKQTLEQVGEVNFWKIAMKPGRPLAFGKIDNCTFFGLPGNPVSAMVTFYQFALPALKHISGMQHSDPLLLTLPCVNAITKRPGRLEYQRALMQRDINGEMVVKSATQQGSGILSSMNQANCFIVLPLECGNLEAGSKVQVQSFAGLI